MSQPNEQPSKRVLVRWTDDHDKELLAWIVFACAESGVKIPFDKVAHYMGQNFSEGAIVQHLAKFRNKCEEGGLHVPPSAKRGVAGRITARNHPRAAATPSSRRSSASNRGRSSTGRGRRRSRRTHIKDEFDDNEEYDEALDQEGDVNVQMGSRRSTDVFSAPPVDWDAGFDAGWFAQSQLPMLDTSANLPQNMPRHRLAGGAGPQNSEDEEDDVPKFARAQSSLGHTPGYDFDPTFNDYTFPNPTASNMGPPPASHFHTIPSPGHVNPYALGPRVNSFASVSSAGSVYPIPSPTTPGSIQSMSFGSRSQGDLTTVSNPFALGSHLNQPQNQANDWVVLNPADAGDAGGMETHQPSGNLPAVQWGPDDLRFQFGANLGGMP